MVKIRSTTSYLPQRYRHRPTVVEGIAFDGTPTCARAIVEWGRARTGNTPFEYDDEELLAITRQGRRYVPDHDTAVLGVVKEAYSIDPEVLAKSYVLLGVDYSAAPLTAGRVAELVTEAKATPDRERLRDIVKELGAMCEAFLE